MKKKVVITCDEREIVDLIQKYITPKYDSIVAAEEIGNQDWTVTVEMPDEFDEVDVAEIVAGAGWGQYHTREILCVLHKMGHLEAGDYIIDCTW